MNSTLHILGPPAPHLRNVDELDKGRIYRQTHKHIKFISFILNVSICKGSVCLQFEKFKVVVVVNSSAEVSQWHALHNNK